MGALEEVSQRADMLVRDFSRFGLKIIAKEVAVKIVLQVRENFVERCLGIPNRLKAQHVTKVRSIFDADG